MRRRTLLTRLGLAGLLPACLAKPAAAEPVREPDPDSGIWLAEKRTIPICIGNIGLWATELVLMGSEVAEIRGIGPVQRIIDPTLFRITQEYALGGLSFFQLRQRPIWVQTPVGTQITMAGHRVDELASDWHGYRIRFRTDEASQPYSNPLGPQGLEGAGGPLGPIGSIGLIGPAGCPGKAGVAALV